MPNHFHILLSQTKDGSISKFMQKLSTSYSMYFNKKNKRTGTLFEGKFKSDHADNDRYLKYLFSYIHLNPVKMIDSSWREGSIKNKTRTLDFLTNYSYSSYQDYISRIRPENIIINPEDFPQYFPSKDSFDKEILDWITFT